MDLETTSFVTHPTYPFISHSPTSGHVEIVQSTASVRQAAKGPICHGLHVSQVQFIQACKFGEELLENLVIYIPTTWRVEAPKVGL